MKPKPGQRSSDNRNKPQSFFETILNRLDLRTPILTERHIYMRSKSSRVQFVVISPANQILILIFILMLGSWVGYATVQTIFGTGIVAIKEQHFQKIQADYEQQISEMRRSYNRLSDKNRLTQNWFLDAITRMEKRHDQLLQLLEKQSSVSKDFTLARQNVHKKIRRATAKHNKTKLMALRIADISPYMSVLPPADKTSITLSLNNRQGLSANKELTTKLEETFPSDIVARVNRLNQRQQDVANNIEIRLDKSMAQMRQAINNLQLGQTQQIVARMAPTTTTWASRLTKAAIGGPYISSNNLAIRVNPMTRRSPEQSLNDTVIPKQQIQRIDAMLDGLRGLSTAVTRLPLIPPLYGAYITSHFGPRIDPFTKKSAMHSGLDFSARPNTPIHSTLPGRVVFAGDKGHYGLLVEVDHGYGFRTRYAHLAKILVRSGQRIRFQQAVGIIGSSGRSTGTHLHYEIWFDGELQNPWKFIEHGQHIYTLPFS